MSRFWVFCFINLLLFFFQKISQENHDLCPLVNMHDWINMWIKHIIFSFEVNSAIYKKKIFQLSWRFELKKNLVYLPSSVSTLSERTWLLEIFSCFFFSEGITIRFFLLQFCDSMYKPVQVLAIAMASYSEGYLETSQMMQVASSVFNSGKYFLDPELRAQQVDLVDCVWVCHFIKLLVKMLLSTISALKYRQELAGIIQTCNDFKARFLSTILLKVGSSHTTNLNRTRIIKWEILHLAGSEILNYKILHLQGPEIMKFYISIRAAATGASFRFREVQNSLCDSFVIPLINDCVLLIKTD